MVTRDGKTIRGSAFHVVRAWIGEHGLPLGQAMAEAKSNESKAVPKLPEVLGVPGDVITADALSCPKATKIREQGADYMLAVKEQQKGLYEDITKYGEGMESGELPDDGWQGEEEQGAGRVEWREAWEDIQTLVHYRTFRKETGKELV